jgi:hypothetical protein
MRSPFFVSLMCWVCWVLTQVFVCFWWENPTMPHLVLKNLVCAAPCSLRPLFLCALWCDVMCCGVLWCAVVRYGVVRCAKVAHRVRNRKTTLMYALALGFVIFINTAYNVEITTAQVSRRPLHPLSLPLPCSALPSDVTLL